MPPSRRQRPRRRAAFAPGAPHLKYCRARHETGTTDGGMHAGPLAARRSLLCGWNLGTAAMVARAGGPDNAFTTSLGAQHGYL